MSLHVALSAVGFGIGYWDPRALAPLADAPVEQSFANPSTELLREIAIEIDMYAFTVRFPQLVSCRFVDEPRASMVLDYRAPGGVGTIVIRPPQSLDRWTGDPSDRLDPHRKLYHHALAELAAHIAANAPRVPLERGWLDAPDVAFERAEVLPHRNVAVASGGAFRTHAGVATEVLAERRISAFEAMLFFLASTPANPWRRSPRAYAVTDDELFVERRDGVVERLPLDALRRRHGGASGDALYLFGRHTCLLVADLASCPIRAELDRRLGL